MLLLLLLLSSPSSGVQNQYSSPSITPLCPEPPYPHPNANQALRGIRDENRFQDGLRISLLTKVHGTKNTFLDLTQVRPNNCDKMSQNVLFGSFALLPTTCAIPCWHLYLAFWATACLSASPGSECTMWPRVPRGSAFVCVGCLPAPQYGHSFLGHGGCYSAYSGQGPTIPSGVTTQDHTPR